MASTTALASLTNTTTGDGSTVDFLTAKKNVTMVVFTSGLVTEVLVQVQASQDGTNWVPISSVEASVRPRGVDLSGGAYRYWRASVTKDALGGGKVSATFMEAD